MNASSFYWQWMVYVFLFIGSSASELHTFKGSYAGEYSVWYKGSKRRTNMYIYCDNTVEQPGIFTDRLHIGDVKKSCSQGRDNKATMFIENTHGKGKYECLRIVDESTLSGHHYTGFNRY